MAGSSDHWVAGPFVACDSVGCPKRLISYVLTILNQLS